MKDIIDSFIQSIDSTEHIIVLYDYLENNHFDAIDYSDLLRWQWVQTLSALDKLIHELVLFHATDLFANNKPKTECFKNFKLSIAQYDDLLNSDKIEFENTVRKIIIAKNSYETFQEPDKICSALSYIWDEKGKFYKIALKMGADETYVKTKLKNIVARRNQIAHQNDMLANNFEKELINKAETLDVIDFIKKLGCAIYDCIAENC